MPHADEASLDLGVPPIPMATYPVFHLVDYPRESLQAGQEETVLLRVQILANGRVGKLQVVHSSGFWRLDEAALRDVKDWLFIPPRVKGQSVATTVLVPVAFQLVGD